MVMADGDGGRGRSVSSHCARWGRTIVVNVEKAVAMSDVLLGRECSPRGTASIARTIRQAGVVDKWFRQAEGHSG